ncbi:hypothetical protein LSPH24S_02280 [Lysinibacillus sphaericus]
MDETATGVQRIAEATQQLHHSAIATSETANTGNNIIEEAQQQMNVINDSTQLINTLVQKLSKQSVEISNITEVIFSNYRSNQPARSKCRYRSSTRR